MSAKPNPASIGIFISGAVVILFISIVVLGTSQLFEQSRVYLMTFREPVRGLQPGSPVKLMGVDIGNVEEISIILDRADVGTYRVNVLVRINQKKAQGAFSGLIIDLEDRAEFEEDIHTTGIRGQLDTQNLLSGQLYVALVLAPDKKGFQLHQEEEHGYWEIPTLTSTKREMVDSLVTSLSNVAGLDLEGAVEELKGLVMDLRSDLAELDLKRVGGNIDQAVLSANALLTNPELSAAITNLNQTLDQLREITIKINAKAEPILAHAEQDLEKLGDSLDEAKATLSDVRALVGPTSPLSRELIMTFDSADKTLTSLRHLIEELKRNPNAIISGKKPNSP